MTYLFDLADIYILIVNYSRDTTLLITLFINKITMLDYKMNIKLIYHTDYA